MTTENDYVPYGMILITCSCCKLRQRVRDRDGTEPTMCDECHQHQGQLPDKLAARAESHEAMLRERLTACRTSETHARQGLEISHGGFELKCRVRPLLWVLGYTLICQLVDLRRHCVIDFSNARLSREAILM